MRLGARRGRMIIVIITVVVDYFAVSFLLLLQRPLEFQDAFPWLVDFLLVLDKNVDGLLLGLSQLLLEFGYAVNLGVAAENLLIKLVAETFSIITGIIFDKRRYWRLGDGWIWGLRCTRATQRGNWGGPAFVEGNHRVACVDSMLRRRICSNGRNRPRFLFVGCVSGGEKVCCGKL